MWHATTRTDRTSTVAPPVQVGESGREAKLHTVPEGPSNASQLCASVEYARQLKHTIHILREQGPSNASARVALLPGDSYVVKTNVNVTSVTVALAHPSKWHECPPRQISRPQGHE